MKVIVTGIECHATCRAVGVGDPIGLLLRCSADEIKRGDLIIGPQRSTPSSVAKIEAEFKQTKQEPLELKNNVKNT